MSYAYYRCTGSDSHRLGGQRVCQNKQVRTEKLDAAVWQDVCELLRHPQLLRKEYERRLASPADSGTQASLKKQATAVQRSVDRLIDAYTDGLLDRTELDPRLARARSRLAKLHEQLTDMETESREQSALHRALACLDSFTESIASNLESADWSTRREILRTLIGRVRIEPDQIRIIYRINFPLFVKKASNADTERGLHFCWSSETRPATRLGLFQRNNVTAHLQSTAWAAMPIEPLLYIVPALDIPVTSAPGTLGLGSRKHRAAEKATQEEGGKAQPHSCPGKDIVTIPWVCHEPYCSSHENTRNQ